MIEENSLISVVVPVYNIKNYIINCVNSIISQTYDNLEIIIIDDGSYDGSEKLCDELKKTDKRIIVVHEKNRGLSAARNEGINISNGEYITFIDGDDYIEKNMIEILYKGIHDAGADISCCGYQEIHDMTDDADISKTFKTQIWGSEEALGHMLLS